MPAEISEKTTVSFKHLIPGKEIPFGIAGYYVLYRESVIPYKDRQVLCLVGKAVIESSCCSTGNWVYVSVPGYVVNWHNAEQEGSPVSDVEPISDPAERIELNKIIEEKEGIDIVYFP